VDYFLLDFAKNNIAFTALSSADQEQLKTLSQAYSLLFHWSDSIAGIQSFLDKVQPYGLALVGGEEEKVGFKSFDELDELLDFLEVEE
jgi:phosphoribosylanthranilate isomerase